MHQRRSLATRTSYGKRTSSGTRAFATATMEYIVEPKCASTYLDTCGPLLARYSSERPVFSLSDVHRAAACLPHAPRRRSTAAAVFRHCLDLAWKISWSKSWQVPRDTRACLVRGPFMSAINGGVLHLNNTNKKQQPSTGFCTKQARIRWVTDPFGLYDTSHEALDDANTHVP